VEEIKDLLEGPEKFEGKGFAARLTYHEERDSYRVESSPLLETGDIDGTWEVFGGSVGYNDSEYSTEEEAREFYEELQNLSNQDILNRMATGEQ